jgi:hypothetical protein
MLVELVNVTEEPVQKGSALEQPGGIVLGAVGTHKALTPEGGVPHPIVAAQPAAFTAPSLVNLIVIHVPTPPI